MESNAGSGHSRTKGKLLLLYTQSYFISVATVLGTGILGLPATLSKSGFYPFLVSFIMNFLMQVLSICQMLEVLQYVRAILSKSGRNGYCRLVPERESLIDNGPDRNESSIQENESHLCVSGACSDGTTEEMTETELGDAPCDKFVADASNGFIEKSSDDSNFHVIGKLFFPKSVQPLYLFVIFIQFVMIIISYSLAGSEAYAQLFGVSMSTMTPYFTWILGLIVIFGHTVIKPAIAVMTFAKGSLLFATVVVSMYAGASIKQEVIDDWAYTDQPLLMGIVALSGLILVMPMLFEKFQSNRKQMQGFRNAVIGGLTTCFILNIMWCWAVLNIVPQTAAQCNASVSSDEYATCDPTLTLEQASLDGEISTVPLTKIMLMQYPDMQWVAVAIQVFILISITVSFLTLGSAMQHSASGLVDDLLARHENWKISMDCCSSIKPNFVWHIIVGLICFSTVFLVAILNPKGFVVILERVSSFGTNAIYGVFIFIWIRAIRSEKYDNINVSLKTGTLLRYSHYLSLIYYTLAILYDIVTWAIGR